MTRTDMVLLQAEIGDRRMKNDYIESIVRDLMNNWTPVQEARSVFIEEVLGAVREIESPEKEIIFVEAVMKMIDVANSFPQRNAA
jgi:hypothetical protein